MTNLLKNINISNMKIDSINMTDLNNYTLFNVDTKEKISNYQICNTLSHIKAINYLKDLGKKYYLVTEDNISFNNLPYFKKNLENIILNSPPFDILILFKKNKINFPDTDYVNWEYYYENNNIDDTDTISYIISNNGVKKICKIAKFKGNVFNLDLKFKFNKASLYLFKYVNTYVYKYNFINTTNGSGTINNRLFLENSI